VAESFGIAQAEAMMCGIPSVTTDLPGGRYPVRATGHGLIVPVGDPGALRRALLKAAGWSPGRRAVGAARAHDLFGVRAVSIVMLRSSPTAAARGRTMIHDLEGERTA
jgi:glycosyltransferase involved in cell wall biosynthesis